MTKPALGLVAAFAFLPLASACQLPGDGPSLLAQQPLRDTGPSGQRIGRDGYPLLGAYPNSAAPQLQDGAVQGERQALTNAGTVQASAAVPTAADYQARVAELRRLKIAQQQAGAEASAAASTATPPVDVAKSNEAVLREIEGR